jgi:hypothetical protein
MQQHAFARLGRSEDGQGGSIIGIPREYAQTPLSAGKHSSPSGCEGEPRAKCLGPNLGPRFIIG